MQIQPLFPLSYLSFHNRNSDKYPDVKTWVINAIAQEDRKPSDQFVERRTVGRISIKRKATAN